MPDLRQGRRSSRQKRLWARLSPRLANHARMPVSMRRKVSARVRLVLENKIRTGGVSRARFGWNAADSGAAVFSAAGFTGSAAGDVSSEVVTNWSQSELSMAVVHDL